MEPVWYGVSMCSAVYQSGAKKGQSCGNKAYYSVTEASGIRYYCGVHSKKDNRTELPKNPNRSEEKASQYQDDLALVLQFSQVNLGSGRRGNVLVSGMKMRREVVGYPGYYKIFPNYKHGGRKDGYGCPALSPMSLGPVHHTIPWLPPARNIENYYQFAKVYGLEIDPNTNAQSSIFLEYRRNGYMDTTPHRHKFEKEYLNKFPEESRKTLYSIYTDRQGNPRIYTYIQSRYFYCKIYELLSSNTQELPYLKQLLASGTNLQIIGYDGHPIFKSTQHPNTTPCSDENNVDLNYHSQEEIKNVVYGYYLDPSMPFGHELVLYTLLSLDNTIDYPWNRYLIDNPDLYPLQLLTTHPI